MTDQGMQTREAMLMGLRQNAETQEPAKACPACGRDPDDDRFVDCGECGDFRPGAAARAKELSQK